MADSARPDEPELQKFSEAELAELQEAFNLFDLDGGGDIDAKELGTVMRSLGYNPTQGQIRELVNIGVGDGQFTARGGLIDFELFSTLMRKKAADEDTEKELKDAFRVLDKSGQGWIDTEQMRLVCKVRRAVPPRRAARCVARCATPRATDACAAARTLTHALSPAAPRRRSGRT